MSHHRHNIAQDHVLPALESAVASVVFGLGPAPTASCGPSASRSARCGVTASATVVDPRTTQEVLNYVRTLANPTLGSSPTAPTLAIITVDEDSRVTVSFLRN